MCVLLGYYSLLTRRVWDIETGECGQTLEAHSGIVWSVGITPDGRTAISGSDDKTVRYGVRCVVSVWLRGGYDVMWRPRACGRRAVCVFVLCAMLVCEYH